MDVVCGVIIPRDSEGNFLTEKKRYIKKNLPDEFEPGEVPECEKEMLTESAYILAKKFSESMKAYEKKPEPLRELSPDMKAIAKIYKRRQREIKQAMARFRKQNIESGTSFKK